MYFGLFRREVALTYTTNGAYPVFGNVFEGGAGLDTAIGIAGFRIIDVTTDVANILFHRSNCFEG